MKYLFYSILVVLSTSFINVNKRCVMQEEVMVLSFHDFFENDTVTCKINNCAMFENKVMNSHKVIGYTGVELTITKDEILLGTSVLKTHCLIDLKKESNVTIILNGYEENFKVDLKQGVYIGFSKKGKRSNLIQSRIPFEYD